MKNLERYVRDNREAFDTFEPSADLWKKIQTDVEKQNGKQPKGRMISFSLPKYSMRIAASVAVFLSLGYLGYNYWKPVQKTYDVVTISPTYAKTLTQFASLVEQKRGELKQIETEDPQLYHQFDTELKALDANYQNLKQELPKNPNQEELLQSMIQNLQWQIDLLNQQLQIIQKIKEAKNEKVKDVV